jgi:ferredoxin/flavodoxin---NADP+ reductase
MTYIITQNCCKDASCVPVCPVECIRPIGGTGSFTDTEMLYIEPNVCIDCGACQEECPVGAVYPEDELPPELERFKEINARYFEHHPLMPDDSEHAGPHTAVKTGSLRVAIVGAGPAGCYAADELIRIKGVEVDLFERLPTPYGLVRYGVAPDHQHTKAITRLFDEALDNSRLRCYFNVGVGTDVTHDELMAHHHAVIYAVGASESRQLGISGEMLPGHCAAADFVGWYNGHPDHVDHRFDLSGERVVIIGNGNVSLDIARVLLSPLETLAGTDIADHALKALRDSAIREVVILARRGPRHAAFSVGEFLALGLIPNVDVIVEADDLEPDPGDDIETVIKLEVAREYAQRQPTPGNKRIVFRFFASPEEVVGNDRARGLRVALADGGTEVIETELILRSTGYQGSAIADVPFDAAAGTVPNDQGRVVDDNGRPVTGVYVTGWIKRGPRGVIGTNRSCAEQTVARLWEDFDAGLLAPEVRDRHEIDESLATRGVTPVGWKDWAAIDEAERERGAESSRPRVKFVDVADMLAVVCD